MLWTRTEEVCGAGAGPGLGLALCMALRTFYEAYLALGWLCATSGLIETVKCLARHARLDEWDPILVPNGGPLQVYEGYDVTNPAR